MTVATAVSENTYLSNGSATVYPFTFATLLATDIVVQIVATDSTVTQLALNTDYTVQNAGFEAGGSITLTTAAASGVRVVIKREVPYTQPTDYKNQGSFYPATHERSFDRATMQIQQLKRGLDSSLQLVPDGTGGFVWDARGSRIIRVGTGFANSDAANVGQVGSGGGGGGGGGGTPSVSLYWEFVGDGTETDFTIPGADVTDEIYYDVQIDGEGQNPREDFIVIVGADLAGSVIRFTVPIPNGVTAWVVLRASSSAAASLITAQIPVYVIPGETAFLDAGVRRGHLLCTNALPVTLTIVANTGDTAFDWKSGDYFSVVQKGDGQVEVVPDTGVNIAIPAGFEAKTRAKFAVLSFVCEDPSTNTWTIGNDMAEAAP